MPFRPGRRLPWIALWLLAAAAGALLIARADIAARRAAFDTDARIAHRLLSQRAVQHDTILATLGLLQPGRAGEAAPEQRLPAVYPQVLQVARRDRDGQWPVDVEALRAGEAASLSARRPAWAGVDLAAGRYWLVLAAEPASYALRIDMAGLTAQAEWPFAGDALTVLWLESAAGRRTLQAGREQSGPARFEARKLLAAESQPFELGARRDLGWAQLPWLAMGGWSMVVAATLAALAAWRRQQVERRRAQELLRLGQVGRLNALGELAAGMAHELNQPLTATLANVQAAQRLLGDDPPDATLIRSAMAQAVQQARRAGDVVGRLRRLVERPELGAALQSLRVDASLRQALDLLEPDCRRLGVVPTLAVEPAGLGVQAEPVALEQIVHNLLSNALQALEAVPAGERQLALVAQAQGPLAVISVRDSGPGLAPEVLRRVFEPFFTTRSGGLGLGLSLSETLAQGMGGALTAHAAAPRGAEFRLALPRAA